MESPSHFLTLFAMLFPFAACFAEEPLPGSPPDDGGKHRILLIPLDDRPACLQWPVAMARIADVELATPPRELLGRFMTPGEPEGIATWLESQDLDTFDAIIVSIDMLAYGGLVASRTHLVGKDEATDRLGILEKIHETHPHLPIYAFSIIMRLAPTADGKNDAWRGALERWAELSPEADTDASIGDEVARIESRIPEEVLADYKRTRSRNLAINRKSVQLAGNGIDYLILGQDDAKPRGVHLSDHESLLAEIKAGTKADQVALQPGADEVAMLLLARALTDRVKASPTIRTVYSSESARSLVAPFEDRPLHETVSLQIAATGARETADGNADLLFHVFASRHEENDLAETFARKVADAAGKGHRVIVADIDTRGNVQGSDPAFTEALLERGVFSQLSGYASWNTAGNTIGTALSQGIIHALSRTNETAENAAQSEFLLLRLLNDYAYHALVRPDINRHYAPEQGMNPLNLSPEETKHLEETILSRLDPLAGDIQEKFSREIPVSELNFTLPWERTFEAEINLK